MPVASGVPSSGDSRPTGRARCLPRTGLPYAAADPAEGRTGFDLEIVIGRAPLAEQVAAVFGHGVPVVALRHGFAFVPFTNAVSDALNDE
jgi:hypothetical protein